MCDSSGKEFFTERKMAIITFRLTPQVPDSSPHVTCWINPHSTDKSALYSGSCVFLCCGHGSRRLPCPQHKNPCEPPKVVRSPEQLRRFIEHVTCGEES